MKMVEYKLIKHPITKEKVVTEDGHVMFIEDVVKRLQRLDYLEREYEKRK